MKQLETVKIEQIKPYKNNARKNDNGVEPVKQSIKQCGYIAPIIVDENYEVLAGHTRLKALKELNKQEIEVLKITGLNEKQKKKYRLLDNKTSEFTSWNFDLLDFELKGLDFEDFDFKWGEDKTEIAIEKTQIVGSGDEWFENRESQENNQKQEGNDEYNEFTEKFQIKLTTDDCYTPPKIYEVIKDYVVEKFKIKEQIIRPFYPNGDYTKEDYKGKVVIDNPPFSLLVEIIKFYNNKGIKFFLFAPNLTSLYDNVGEVTNWVTNCSITYENGAVVNTSFITNMDDLKIFMKTDPKFTKLVNDTNKELQKENTTELPKYEYPANVFSKALLSYFATHGVDFEIPADECFFIRQLESQKSEGKAIFGGGVLCSERLGKQAEEARKQVWGLSKDEKEIVKILNKNYESKLKI